MPGLKPIFELVWSMKVSPFGVGRFMGETQAKRMIESYVFTKQNKMVSQEEKQAIADYMFQIIMRNGTTEYAIHLMFNSDMHAHLPLSDKLAKMPLPVSFYYGEGDWVFHVEDQAGKECVLLSQKIHGQKSRYYIVPNADHNMHMDNPEEFSKMILDDL
jgi:cardiolipin-specific phospholipase